MSENRFSYSMTGYEGNEENLLRLLNRNRATRQDRNYLDWRYLGEPASPPAILFWVHDEKGKRVGVSSLIFRAYCVDGEPCFFGVRGDTSLEKAFRGQGLGKGLFIYMMKHIDEQEYVCTFGLANEASARASVAAGWTVQDSFLPYVLVIDPADKLFDLCKNRFAAERIGGMYGRFYKRRTRFFRHGEFRTVPAEEFDGSFDETWRRIRDRKGIMRRKDAPTLNWRYARHPQMKFLTKKVLKGHEVVGFAIYRIVRDVDGQGWNVVVCTIYDFCLTEREDVPLALKTLIRDLLDDTPEITSIRINMNEKNPEATGVQKAGFRKRGKDGVLTTYMRSGSIACRSNHWFMTLGDKDI